MGLLTEYLKKNVVRQSVLLMLVFSSGVFVGGQFSFPEDESQVVLEAQEEQKYLFQKQEIEDDVKFSQVDVTQKNNYKGETTSQTVLKQEQLLSIPSLDYAELILEEDNNKNKITNLVNLYRKGELGDFQQVEQLLNHPVLSDPFFLEEFFLEFVNEDNDENKQAFKDLMYLANSSQVVEMLSNYSQEYDLETKLASFELMSEMDVSSNPEMRRVLSVALRDETDERVLAAVLNNMNYHPTAPEEIKIIQDRLGEKLDHPSAIIRSAALAKYVEWSKDGSGEKYLVNSLSDSSLDVRAQAVMTINEKQVRSPEIKSKLMDMLFDPDVPNYLSKNAKDALFRAYDLNEVEYELIHDL